MSGQISDTIGYNSLHSDGTAFPFTYNIRGNSIELYVHHITFSVSGQFFVPQNELLLHSCNIGTYAHLLFNKALYTLSSKLQELLGKVISPLEY